ncbi:hypothetical protein ACHAWF_006305, partial [Thalassiosira exigua]
MGVLVVAPRDVGVGQEQLEVVRLLVGSGSASSSGLGQSPPLVPLDLLHPLLAMGAEPQFLLVAPQHRIGLAHPVRLGRVGFSPQYLAEVRDLILAVISHEDQQGALVRSEAGAEERPDAGVELLPDH